MDEKIDRVARMIMEARKVVIFTGAGVSTESGIPDFRSPGGIWDKYDPEDFTFQRFVSSEAAREKYWTMSTEFYSILKDVEPNEAHQAVARLEELGRLDCVITQNIDGLHQKAGNSPEKVIELHGTALSVVCLDCGKRYSRQQIDQRVRSGIKVPRCDLCKGLLKPATISFGQAMPEHETAEAFRRSRECDLFIVIGSSLVVHPAASMPLAAKESGAKLVIINRDGTPYDSLADVVLHGQAGPIMSEILRRVEGG